MIHHSKQSVFTVKDQQLIEAIEEHAILSVTDAAGTIIEVNDKFCEISGYSTKELLGQNHRIIKSGLHSESFYESLWRTITQGTAWGGEVCNRKKDGSEYWVKATIVPILDDAGLPNFYVSIRTDITKQKLLELALKEKIRELQLHHNALKAISQGVVISGTDRRIMFTNDAFERITGYSQKDFLNKSCAILQGPETNAETINQIRSALDQSQPFHGEILNYRKDGTAFWNELSITPILDSTGRLHQFIGVQRDISERKRLDKELQNRQTLLQRAVNEANAANQAKSAFLSSMSHELRTPMNSILGFAQLMEIDSGLSEDQKDNAHEILKAGRHLLSLINDVLDLAKVETGKMDMSIDTVHVDELVADCIGLIEPMTNERKIVVKYEDFSAFAVLADRVRLKQGLLNLLSNAVKYSHRAHGQIRLWVETLKDGNGEERLRLHVEDSGPGIPPGRMGELFQPFSRLGVESSSIEGTGIGLSITKRIIEKMDGAVGVKSKPGKGADFWIELPRARRLPFLLTEALPLQSFKALQQPHNAEVDYTVLYIEDNPANLRLMIQILASRPHIRLLTAHTGELGLSIAASQPINLILLDINLGDINGYTALDALHQQCPDKHIPIIALSANAMPSDIARGRAAGFDDYLTKPLDVPHFLGVIDQHLTHLS